MKHGRKERRKQKVGIAWYRPEQWERLLEVSVDREKLEETHAEWLAEAEKDLAMLQRNGVGAERVDVGVEGLVRWCAEKGLPLNAEARAQFVTGKVSKKYGAHEKPPSL